MRLGVDASSGWSASGRPAHEVLGLTAAQAVLGEAPAVPVLVAAGQDEAGPWLITPFYAGRRVGAPAVPVAMFESLAALHARYAGDRSAALEGIPVVDAGWWRNICLSYAMPAVERQASLRPHPVLDRARAVLQAMADDDRVAVALGRLPRTLLHGDVHPGNILVKGHEVVRVDWGSARIGPAMLDLANVTQMGSAQFAAYARARRSLADVPLGPPTVELGYAWAALQIPVQYLAWVVATRSPQEVGQALDRAESALAALPSMSS